MAGSLVTVIEQSAHVDGVERLGQLRRVVAMLKMENMRLPQQQQQLGLVCRNTFNLDDARRDQSADMDEPAK